MSITPKREDAAARKGNGFSPLILRQSPAAGSPQKNLTGPPRVARDITADLYNNIQHWNDSHVRGAELVKQIAVLKSDDIKNYTIQLEEYTNELFNVVKKLETYKKQFENYTAQINALTKLQKNSQPIFISLDAVSLANLIETIADAYLKEYKLKEMVLGNIAHSKNKNEVMYYAACWTHQIYVNSNINLKLETLLIETGFRSFN